MSDKIKKLSDAMELGATFVRERNDLFLLRNPFQTCGCALGTAYAVCFDDCPDNGELIKAKLSQRFGASRDRIQQISNDHATLLKTRAEIIKELQAEGL